MRLATISLSIGLLFLSACSTTLDNSTPETAQFSWQPKGYWRDNPNLSVATNMMALAGAKETFYDKSAPKGESGAGVADLALAGTAGYIASGLTGMSIMSMGTLLGNTKTDNLNYINVMLFIENPNNLPFDDVSLLVKGGEQVKSLFDYSILKVNDSAMKCDLTASYSYIDWTPCKYRNNLAKADLYEVKAIRPATGQEVSQLGLPAGHYSLIRYVSLFNIKPEQAGHLTNGYVFYPSSKTKGPEIVQISGKRYFFVHGVAGQTGY